MPIWAGVRPGTLQNTIMDWFFDHFEGTTADLAKLVYRDATCYSRNRIRRTLAALQEKGLLSQPKRGSWRVAAIALEVGDAESQELRIRELESRITYLELKIDALSE